MKILGSPADVHDCLPRPKAIALVDIQSATAYASSGAPVAGPSITDLAQQHGVSRESLHAFIDSLGIPADAKQRLKALTPATYIGKAADLASRV